MSRKKVCFLADTHALFDDRIYWKEALSLKNAGYDIHYCFIGNVSKSGITEHGIHYIEVPRKIFLPNRILNYFCKLWFFIGEYCQLYKLAKKIKADVYHIHDLRVNRIGGKLKRLVHSPKIIYDVHEPHRENIIDYRKTPGILSPVKRLYANYVRRWEIKKAKQYDFVIATEENVCDVFRKYLPENKVDIIYNYTNLCKYRKDIPDNEKKYDFIYTGGITELRGAIKILEAAALLNKQIADFKILFLGRYFPPELKDEMLNFIQDNGLTKNVELFDPVPYTKVPGFYNNSRFGLGLFQPIPTHFIILQIKIFEYMCFGLPIIGSNFGHIKEYIEKDKAGLSVNPENPQEISEVMLKLITNKKLAVSMSDNAIKASESDYRWEFMEEKLKNIYINLLNKD